MEKQPNFESVGERIEAGLQLMRTHAVDGRAILIATIEDFFKGLFDEEKPPVLGQLAFWTTKDGSQWLTVEREISPDMKTNFIIGRGEMNGADEVRLTALAVIHESGVRKRTRKLENAALFLDTGSDDVTTALTIQKKLGEGEFVSHAQPALWRDAVLFRSFKEEDAALAVAPVADAADDDDQDTGGTGDVPQVLVDDGSDGSNESPFQYSDDADSFGSDDPTEMMNQRSLASGSPEAQKIAY